VIETGYFKSVQNKLYYNCAIPSGRTKRCGIIFVHAADGNRMGPHRMFVELAREFNAIGYPTLRFDLTGCGDSTGTFSAGNINIEVLDVVNAVRFFSEKAGVDGVVVFAISRGARVCYNAISRYNLPLDAMILLSTPISSGRAGLNTLTNRLKQYLYKLKDRQNLIRLFCGKVNMKLIWKTLTTAANLTGRYERSDSTTFVSKPSVLLVYGQYDPIGKQASSHYTANFTAAGIPAQCHVITGANHSFFHYTWKQEIFDVSSQWLSQISDARAK